MKGAGPHGLPPTTHWVSEALSEVRTTFCGYGDGVNSCTGNGSGNFSALEKTKSIVQAVNKKSTADTVWVAIDPCPFYPRGGGQECDTGEIRWKVRASTGSKEAWENAKVISCERVPAPNGGKFLAVLVQGSTEGLLQQLACGTLVEAHVDSERRSGCSVHHTATHLLHAVLRDHQGRTCCRCGRHCVWKRFLSSILKHICDFRRPFAAMGLPYWFLTAPCARLHTGPQVQQAGSHVAPDNLHIDLLCSPLDADAMAKVVTVLGTTLHEYETFPRHSPRSNKM